MSDIPLFRNAALEAQRVQWHGEIVMAQPVSYKFLTGTAAVLAASLIAFAVWGSYTKRVTVPGQIVPTKGVVKVYVQQPGIVVEEHVVEGQHVDKGNVLFVLSSERQSSTMGETQAAISRETQARQQSLRDELVKIQQLRQFDHDSTEKKVFGLRAELSKLRNLIEGQRNRTELADEAYKRYQSLLPQGFVSQDQLIQKQADALDQRSRMDSLERDKITTQRNLVDAQNQLDTLAIKYDNQVADIERNIATAEQELMESEARRRLVIVASATGTATAVTALFGQIVDTSKPLVAIVPEGAQLQANLYAPSRAVGFVKPGDVVNIRYQAYPYQKFGQYRGTVASIANTALSSAELTGTNVFAGSTVQGGEPLYRISVDLESQTITAYGKQQSLQGGMLLDADVLQETRKLYEWVLEPLYSLSGKL